MGAVHTSRPTAGKPCWSASEQGQCPSAHAPGGGAALHEWEDQTKALQSRVPQVHAQASQQVLSADGAMVPLVGGVWAEVKTLVVGEVEATNAGEKQVQHPSYCSRLTDVTGFEQATMLVESANKLVVEARFKGAGMHWKRENVNPMLVLRNAVCNDRWDETWLGRMKQARLHRKQKRERHRRVRVEQATQQLMRLFLPIVLSKPHHHEPVASPVSSVTSPATPPTPAPKGRTQAQYRWGRRPVSPRGAQLQAGFAKP